MDSILGLIGLTRRAGHLQAGEEPTLAAARSGKARLILLAADAAENTARRAQRFSEEGGAPRLTLPFTKAEFGGVLGRSVCAIAAVTDTGLAAQIAKKSAAREGAAAPIAEQLGERAKREDERRHERLTHERNRKRG